MSTNSRKGYNNEAFQEDGLGEEGDKDSRQNPLPHPTFVKEDETSYNPQFKETETANPNPDNPDVKGYSSSAVEPGDTSGVDNNADRDTWDNPIEFLLSCISMSVGLGNVWRFPGVAAKNGGGAFLIPYLIVLVVIGRPMYYLEMCMGQFSRFGQVKVWNMVPLFKGVGYGSVTATICICSYYCSLIGITVFYFIKSFAKELPWSVCHPDVYVNVNCSDPGTEGKLAELYYKNIVFPQVPDINHGLGGVHWELLLCLLFSWLVIFLTLVRGVKSSGKVAYFTALFPYLVLFILLIRGVTLDGAGDGIEYFFKPQWKKLIEPRVWYAAVEQCFFSLGIAFGPIIMFSSYNPFRQNIYKDVLIVSVLDTLTSILAGCTIFSVMGFLAKQSETLTPDKPIKLEEMEGGASLAFILYPQAIAQFGWAPQLFAVLFFVMLFTLGIGTASSLTGGAITIICDQFPTWKRWMVTLVVTVCGCLVGIMYVTEGGLFMLDLVDHYGAGFIVYVMAMLECAGISYVYGLQNFCRDIEYMLNRKVGIYWRVCWSIIIPIGLLVILLYYLIDEPEYTSGGVAYPKIATVFGWLITTFAVALFPAWGVHAVVTRKASSLREQFTDALKPTHRWGPQEPQLRRDWLAFRAMRDSEKSRFWIFS